MALRLTAAGRGLVAGGSLLAAAGAAHAAGNAVLLRRPPADPPPCRRSVSVLVPARDEERVIGACVASLLGQHGVSDFEILVLDDGSTDGTADTVRAAAAGDSRLRLLNGAGDPPPGWLGKSYACAQLAAAARGDVLVFVDADVVLAPHAIAAAVSLLDAARLDLVSPHPRELADGPLPRLVQPLLQWSFLTFVPLRIAERSRRPSLSVATGQFLAVTRAAYDAAGGHAAVRAAITEDLALLRAVKRAGGTGGVADGTALAECRMYDSAAALVAGYRKWLWTAFGSPAGAAAVCTGLAVAYVVPALAAARGSRIGLAGYLAGVAGRVVSARRTGGRAFPDALAHPASVAAFCWLVGRSYAGRRAGSLAWKGRPVI